MQSNYVIEIIGMSSKGEQELKIVFGATCPRGRLILKIYLSSTLYMYNASLVIHT